MDIDEGIKSYSRTRLTENELIFKEANRQVKKATEKVLTPNESDVPVNFYCECSFEGCKKKISLTSDEYRQVREDPDWCFVLPGHENLEIEKIIEQKINYLIVEKTDKQRLRTIRKKTGLP